MCFLYFTLAFYPNANATQIVLPILHLDFLFYFGKFGVLFKDYEKIFSKFDHHICKKETLSETFAFSDLMQDK